MDETERLFRDFLNPDRLEPDKHRMIARHDRPVPERVTYFGKRYLDVTKSITESNEEYNG